MINQSLIRLIAKEHSNAPICGRVLTLGRQTFSVTIDEAVSILRSEGVDVSADRISQTKTMTLDSETRYGAGATITDKQFFNLLGDCEVNAMDVSTYENAEIIHNLNFPIPQELEGSFDYIIDGGTFDHLFDLKTALSNITRILKEDGRLLMWNGASNFTGVAYMSFAPDFFRDYMLVNKFKSVHVYIAETVTQAQGSQWEIYEYLRGRRYSEGMDAFHSPFLQMTIVAAQKGPETTHSEIPVQCFYRDEDQWPPYEEAEEKLLALKSKSFTGNTRFKILRFLPRLAIVLAFALKHRLSTKAYKYLGRI